MHHASSLPLYLVAPCTSYLVLQAQYLVLQAWYLYFVQCRMPGTLYFSLTPCSWG